MTDGQRKSLLIPFDEATARRIRRLYGFSQDAVRRLGLTPTEMHWLFTAMEVLGKDGKWHELIYGANYSLRLEYGDITLVPDGRISIRAKLKDEYRVPTWRAPADDVRFPLFTGYHKALNGDKLALDMARRYGDDGEWEGNE